MIGCWVCFETRANWSFYRVGYGQEAWYGCSPGEATVPRVGWPCPSPLRCFPFSKGTHSLGMARPSLFI